MPIGDSAITKLLFAAMALSGVTAIVLCIAEFVLHRPIPVPVPSVYWPVASLGFSPNRKVRRVFRFLFCNLYRKRFWNPLVNTSLKQKGFDRQRHLSSSNIHAACSALVLTIIAIFLHGAHQFAALQPPSAGGLQTWRQCYAPMAIVGGFELVFNLPAIVLGRYLYLLTLRRH
jgi:hypothetical protein